MMNYKKKIIMEGISIVSLICFGALTVFIPDIDETKTLSLSLQSITTSFFVISVFLASKDIIKELTSYKTIKLYLIILQLTKLISLILLSMLSSKKLATSIEFFLSKSLFFDLLIYFEIKSCKFKCSQNIMNERYKKRL